MVLIVVLSIVFALGPVAIWRWGHLEVVTPWADDEPSKPPTPGQVLTRYVWHVAIGVGAGLLSGTVMSGVGGRLAMRVLAVTAGPEAQGRLTEAEEIVGEITLGGSIGFIAFFGIFIGLITGVGFMLIRRWLPPGRWAGITFGLLLLVLFGTRAEPLRAENPDFDIVGPGWLAIALFGAIAVGHGMLLAALAGRYSRALPLASGDPRHDYKYAPLLFLVPAFPFLVPLAVGASVAFLMGRIDGLDRVLASRRTQLTGWAVGIAIVAIAAPGFFVAVVDIAGRP